MSSRNVLLFTMAVLLRLPAFAQVDPLDPALKPHVTIPPPDQHVRLTESIVKVPKTQSIAGPGTSSIELLAARNEFESFQIHITNPAGAGIYDFDRISVSTLRHQDTVHTIYPSNIAIYREEYIYINTPSDGLSTVGWYPDALIPQEVDGTPYVTPPIDKTQSYWVDIFVPSDALPGWYSATIEFTKSGYIVGTFPLILGVWDFELPSTPTLKTAFQMSNQGLCKQISEDSDAGLSDHYCAIYPNAGGNDEYGTELQKIDVAKLFLNNRVTISGVVYAREPRNWTDFDGLYGPLLAGNAPGVFPGARLNSLMYGDPRNYFAEGGSIDIAKRYDVKNRLESWMWHADAKGWSDRLFFYDCDEPSSPTSRCGGAIAALDQGRMVDEATQNTIPYLLTTQIDNAGPVWPVVKDVVDIVTPTVNELAGSSPTRPPEYETWLNLDPDPRKTRAVWWYQSCMSHDCATSTSTVRWPSYMIDADSVRNRIFQWLAFKYDVTGELYYGVDECFFQPNCSSPWTSQHNYTGNGDGTLYYPGTPKWTGRDNSGESKPIPSIRLKHIRDGIEDYEYLFVAAIEKWWPSSLQADLSAYDNTPFIASAQSFPVSGADLQAVRSLLGYEIHSHRGTQSTCKRHLDSCAEHAICSDTTAGFTCNSCEPGFILSGSRCVDVDECSGAHGCVSPAECKNTLGTYSCVCPDDSVVQSGQVCRMCTDPFGSVTGGKITFQASTCFDATESAHFHYARGAYANAEVFDANLNLLGEPACNYGPDCLFNSLSCACPMDSQLKPGERSCGCVPQVEKRMKDIPKGASSVVTSALLVDWDGDGVENAKFSGDSGNLRIRQLGPNQWLHEWEDQNGAQGDFNDYSSVVEFKQCGGGNGRWPDFLNQFDQSTMQGEEHAMTCFNRCAGNPNLNACAFPKPGEEDDLQFLVTVAVDDMRAESDREGMGQSIHLNVTTYSQKPQEIAVCPVLHLNWVDPLSPDPSTELFYSTKSDECDTSAFDAAVPKVACTPGVGTVMLPTLPISFSRSHGLNACPKPQADDRFVTDAVTVCGNTKTAGTTMQEYEVSLAEINARLTKSQYPTRGTPRNQVASVELFVFEHFKDPLGKSAPFSCPAGVNAVLGQSHPGIATIRRFLFVAPGSTATALPLAPAMNFAWDDRP